MYKRILVPTDGSPLSIEAVRGAARFAKPLGASVVLITVIEPYSYTSLSEYRPVCPWKPLPSNPSRQLKR